jgi:Predicted membrane protein (DUF2157)
MKISKDDMQWAASEGIISPEQADRLWAALGGRAMGGQRFDGVHVAYYFGALLVIAAMGWFMTTAWESFGGAGLFLIALLYAVSFVLAGRTLWDRQGLRVPGGLLYTMAVCMTPLAVYGLQRALGLWPQGDPGPYRGYHIWVKGSWLLIELGTIAAALAALRFRRFPFLTAPIAFSLWYMSMDLTPLLFGKEGFTWDERKIVSVWFGLAMLLVAYLVDLRGRGRADFAFWGYLFGLMAFWGGLSMMESGSQLSKFFYCLINIGLIGLSLLLRQRAFIVFGSMGVFGYLGYLAHRVFADSLLFPFALSLIGVLLIYLGVLYQKNGQRIELFAQTRLPAAVRRMVPPRARTSQ